MARVNPRLVFWIKAVHRHPALTSAHRDVLTYLATERLDFETGRGYCSEQSLVEGRGHSTATVRRALKLARTEEPKLLERTRRGHHLGDDQAMASEWRLIYPPMPAGNSTSTGQQRPVEEISTGQRSHPNRSEIASQPVTRDRPSGIESSTGIEAPTGHRAAQLLRAADPEVTTTEAREVLAELATRPAVRDPLAVLHAEIANGNGYALLGRARHRLTRCETRLTGEPEYLEDPPPMRESIDRMRGQLSGGQRKALPRSAEHIQPGACYAVSTEEDFARLAAHIDLDPGALAVVLRIDAELAAVMDNQGRDVEEDARRSET